MTIVDGADVPVREAYAKKKLTEDQDYFRSDEDGWKAPSSTVLANWLREWDFSYDADTDTYVTIWNRSTEDELADFYSEPDYFDTHSCVVSIVEKGSTVEVMLDCMFVNGPETVSQTFKNNDATIIADIEKFIDENQEKLWTASESVEEACNKKKLTEEDEEIEIVDDEAPTEEPVAEDEPRQVICECDKCGALVIRDEADIVVDEKTDLVNVEEECKFCEEAKGFKIVGVMVPYEVAEVAEVAEEAPAEESDVEDETDIIDEDLADIARKVFDRPASVATQQRWEDELNDDSISDKRRKHLEKKFLQQRDWEERHPDKEVKY
jgi:hypothetical protein